MAIVAIVASVVCVGCTHSVVITSNVPEAKVRVDGEHKGQVKDGASFVERGGFNTVYDVDVTADGYVTARRQLRPSLKDSGVGVMATLGIFCGAFGMTCVAPTSGLVGLVLDADGDDGAGAAAYAIAVGAFAGSALAIGTAAWGVQQLPDEVMIELDAEDVGLGGAMLQ